MKKITVNIDCLLLSLENPRLKESINQIDVIKNMVGDQDDRIYELAKDILSNGLNPIENIAVTPTANKQYIVREGNRRITAIKLINNPKLLENIDNTLHKKFENLKIENKQNLTNIEVAVFNTEEELDHWIELKHLGANKGVGVQEWDSIQKERYAKKKTGASLLLDFFDKLQENKVLTEDEIQSITKTNWDRVLSKLGLQFLEIEKINNSYILPDNLELFKLKMRKIYEELGNQTVEIVYDKEKQEQLFNKISIELFDKPFTRSTLPFTLFDSNQVSHHNLQAHPKNAEHPIINPANSDTNFNPKKPKDIFANCKTIIPSKYTINSTNTRINKIIIELKHLKVDDYPNACGTLLRLLFELSAKNYIQNHQIQIDQNIEEISFESAIKKASNHMRENKILDNHLHSALMKEINNIRLIFNGYMHNFSSYPSPTSLKVIFISHKEFLEKCQD